MFSRIILTSVLVSVVLHFFSKLGQKRSWNLCPDGGNSVSNEPSGISVSTLTLLISTFILSFFQFQMVRNSMHIFPVVKLSSPQPVENSTVTKPIEFVLIKKSCSLHKDTSCWQQPAFVFLAFSEMAYSVVHRPHAPHWPFSILSTSRRGHLLCWLSPFTHCLCRVS